VNGNDTNNGTNANTAWQHLATVPTYVPNGSSICLRRGSVFTDSGLIIGIIGDAGGPNGNGRVDNLIVKDYGPANLPMPLIDNTGVIAPGAWTAVVDGNNNLYKATVTGSGGVQASSFVNVFECKTAPCTPTGAGGNDTFLSFKTSEADANSTLGSFWINGQTASKGPANMSSYTIYMRSSDDTNPGSNGYTYTYSKSHNGIITHGSNHNISNIAVKKSDGNGGGFYNELSGGNATYNNIESNQMGKHNMICGGGCTVNNSTFIDEYYPGSGNMFVAFDGIGSGLPITLNNNTFLNGVLAAGNSVAAIYGHVGSGALFSNLSINGGLIAGVNGASFSGASMGSAESTISGLTCNNVRGCIGAYSTTSVTNTQDYSTTPSANFLSTYSSPVAVTISSSSACENIQYNHSAVGAGSGNSVIVASSTFYFLGIANYGIGFGGAGGSLNLRNTIFDSSQSGNNFVFDGSAISTAPYTGDYNSFVSPNVVFGWINNVSYSGLSAWQSAVFPQDAHSTTTSPTPNAQTIACTLHQIAFTGPSSGNVNSPSSSFTFTPNVSYNSVGQRIGYVGTVTVTPTGTAAAGLSPITLTFTSAASTTPQTFTITPTATGTISLSAFIDGSTENPTFLIATSTTSNSAATIGETTLSYTVNATTPSAPYGPILATAGNTTASVSWSAPASIGGSPITSYTVTSSPGNISTTTINTSATLNGLTNGTSYTFSITANNAVGTGPSSAATNQITPSTLPILTTSQASGITTTGVTFNGSLTDTGGSNAIDSGFIYGTDPTLATIIATSSLGAQTGTTTLTKSITALTANTTYYYRSYSVNISGIGYGTIQTFTTSPTPVITLNPVSSGSSSGGSSASSRVSNLMAMGNYTLAQQIAKQYGITVLTQNITGNATAANSGSSFTRTLRVGVTSDDVKKLQIFLNAQGFIVAKKGAGSLGHETSYFGPATKAALMRFQLAHKKETLDPQGLKAPTGFFGVDTMKAVNALVK
jgi:hypothetical protein